LSEEKKLFEEPPLFGDMDGIVNVIETEFTDVSNQISKLYEKKGKISDEIKLLEKRLFEVGDARSQARKMSAAMKDRALADESVEFDPQEPEADPVETLEDPEKETL
jgi:hypothetical protein